MDDADRANDYAERELEQIIDRCRHSDGVSHGHSLYRLGCDTCREPLPEHRRERGRCLSCQEARELRQRTQAVGI